ncbi:DUF2809 domain-containing protein [Kozakia baliensis]|uniref:ribosomal maturation YjgA family protein n=1 Tax=Kozakia baliensis TaxID=153496 RepID=UPI00345B6703
MRHNSSRADVSLLRVFLLMVLVIISGAVLRIVPLGLPFFVTKWGGTWLWGMMFWCVTTLLFLGRYPFRAMLVAILLASLTECLKLVHTPLLDHFRAERVGRFLLGRHFALADLAVYAAAVIVATWCARTSFGRKFLKASAGKTNRIS